MLQKRIQKLKNSSQNLKAYFQINDVEITLSNMRVVRILSYGTVIINILCLWFTPKVLPNWKPTIYHLWLELSMLFFGVLSDFLLRFKKNGIKLHMEKTIHILFILVLMQQLIFLDTVAFPHASQVFFVIFITVMPVLFILPVPVIIFLQTIYLFDFVLMVLTFKAPEIIGGDLFAGILGYAMSFVFYEIVLELRVHDFLQKNFYKISSEKDGLTGIDNRSTAENKVKEYLNEKEEENPCTMIVLDVDNFKQVNDKLGHEKGDTVLKEVAHILQEITRASDIVGRFGGDEFIILLKGLSDETIINQKCSEVNCATAKLMDGRFGFSCSMGVCILQSGRTSIEELFRVADESLYEAKAFGKATHVIHYYRELSGKNEETPLMIIVDDSKLDQEIMSIQFEKHYQIMKFDDAFEALSYVQKNAKKISVILMDMIMPRITGYEMLSKLKEDPKTAWIPVIAVSSDGTTEEDALKAGAEDMIVKPIVPAIAKLRVENVMKKNR